MQRFNLLLVPLVVGVFFYACYVNNNLREKIHRTTRALREANKTDLQLQVCRKSLGEHKLFSIRVDSEKKTLNWRIRHLDTDMKKLKEKADKLPEKDKKIKELNEELKKVIEKETTVKKLLEEAQKALDILNKEKEGKAKNANAAPPALPNPPKQQ
ncbi:uncharacterized protein LOC127007478 [Eriocheir sinensis]|uniref:uncharacterized protein LOC127007478 n=1 Tax=Eriocheir sinensis TaxID=95602 RepID=UPI0021C572D9|nr:uncharacterized protein LOC127007478 [Eriocheir sinensis]